MYAYVITQDICNKFIEVIFLWDVWFGRDATNYSNTQSTPNDSYGSFKNKNYISKLRAILV